MKYIYFKKLTLENWAQYQNISFDFPKIDLNKKETKVLYFLAENGVGKTRLLEAFRAVLFGENDSSLKKYEKGKLFELFPTPKKEDILNKLKNGEDIDPQNIVLILEFIVSEPKRLDEYYKIERIWTYKNFSLDEQNNIIFNQDYDVRILVKSTGGIYQPIKNEEFFNKLQEFWPEESRDFYFFDGEKLQKMMEDPEKKEIKEKALKNSDYNVINEYIISDLENVKGDFEKEKSLIPRKKNLVKEADDEINKINKKIKEKTNEKKRIEEKIEKENRKLEKFKEIDDKEFKEKFHEIKRYEKAKPIIDKLKELKKKREKIYEEIAKLMGDYDTKNYNFELLLIKDIIFDVMEDLKEKKRKNIIPTKLDKATIEYIKSLKVCLCGNKIGEKELENLQKHQEMVIDENLNEKATEFLNLLIKTYENLEDIEKKLDEKSKKFIKISEEIEKIHEPSQPKDISELLSKYLENESNKKSCESEINSLKDKLEKIKEDIKKLEEKKNQWDNKRLRRLAAKDRIEKSDLCYILAKDCFEKFKQIKNELESKIIETIKNTTNECFLNLIPDKDKYLGVIIDDDWKFGYILKNSPNTPVYNPSKGQFHVIGLSFLKSISKVAKHKVPILFDTPFGRLSSRPKINIGKSLPTLFESPQIFIFLTEEEARNMLDYISDKEGIELFNNTGSEITFEKIKDYDDLKNRLDRIKKKII
ncbi:MAG: hypothetical protein ACP6IY_19395 [Promethearchaeia archaeon]